MERVWLGVGRGRHRAEWGLGRARPGSAGGLPPRVGRAGGGVGVQKRRGALRAFLCGTNLQASETSLELAGSTLPLSQHFHLDVSNSGCGYLRLQCNDSKAEREEKGEEFLHLSPVFLRSGE